MGVALRKCRLHRISPRTLISVAALLACVLVAAAGMTLLANILFLKTEQFAAGGLLYTKYDDRSETVVYSVDIIPRDFSRELVCVLYIPSDTPYQRLVADNVSSCIEVDGVTDFSLRDENTRAGNRVVVVSLKNCESYSTIRITARFPVRTMSFSVKPLLPSDYDRQAYLFLGPDGQNGVNPNSEVVLSVAGMIGGENRWEISRRAALWAAENIKYEIIAEDRRSVDDTLKERRGDCDDMAAALVSILRAKGVPSRVIIGCALRGTNVMFHAWAEAYTECGWVPIDATNKRNPFGALTCNHIRLRCEYADDLGNILRGARGTVYVGVIGAVGYETGRAPLITWKVTLE